MHKLTIMVLASLSLVAASSTFAADNRQSLSRAEVQSEYQRARAAGEINDSGYPNYDALAKPASTLSRTEVMAEYQRALAAGEVQRHNSGYPDALNARQPAASKLSREDVKAEYLRAKKAGELSSASGYPSAPLARHPG